MNRFALLAIFIFLVNLQPAAAQKNTFYSNKVPDFYQLKIEEEDHGFGLAYCAPVAASNVFMWLHPDRVNQTEMIKLLATPEYMNTDIQQGTQFDDFIKGIDLYMNNFLGGYKSLSYQGVGYVEPEYQTNIYIPDLDWMTKGLGMKMATWLRIGFYSYDEKEKIYTRQYGHMVNLVGYNFMRRKNILIIHDPASEAVGQIDNNLIEVDPIEEGLIKYGDMLSFPAKGYPIVKNGKELNPKADAVIIEGALRLVTN